MSIFKRYQGKHRHNASGPAAAAPSSTPAPHIPRHSAEHIGVTKDSPSLAEVFAAAEAEEPAHTGDALTTELTGILTGVRRARRLASRRLYRSGERTIVTAPPAAYATTDVALAMLEAAIAEVLGDVAERLDRPHTQPTGEPLPPIDPTKDTLELVRMPILVGRS